LKKSYLLEWGGYRLPLQYEYNAEGSFITNIFEECSEYIVGRSEMLKRKKEIEEQFDLMYNYCYEVSYVQIKW
jgi:hypothetical protein